MYISSTIGCYITINNYELEEVDKFPCLRSTISRRRLSVIREIDRQIGRAAPSLVPLVKKSQLIINTKVSVYNTCVVSTSSHRDNSEQHMLLKSVYLCVSFVLTEEADCDILDEQDTNTVMLTGYVTIQIYDNLNSKNKF